MTHDRIAPPQLHPYVAGAQQRPAWAPAVTPPDRPAQARAAGRAGSVLVAVGLLLVALSGWELAGSDLYANWQADRLTAQLDRAPTPLSLIVNVARDELDPTVGGNPAAEPPVGYGHGDALAVLQIDRIGLATPIVVGTAPTDLAKAPGWVVGSALPGTPGNSVISGHRSTYGAPFRDLDRLEQGDRITISRPGHPDAVYEVRASRIVTPEQVEVAAPTSGVRLTLTTCHPVGSARERLIVHAELVEGTWADRATPADEWQLDRSA